MLSWNYIKDGLRRHIILIMVASVLIGLLQYLIISILISLDFINLVANFVRQLPAPIQQFIGEEFFARFSLQGAMAFGYNHPFVLVLIGFIAIMLPSRHIAGEIEDGSLELLIALPLKRNKLMISLIVLCLSALALAVAGGWCGTLLGMMVFPGSRVVSFGIFLQIGLNLWLLMVCVSSYTLLISSICNEGGRTATIAAVLTLLFYFVNYIARINESLHFLIPLTIFGYYEPMKIISGGSQFTRDILILGILSLLFFSAAIWHFRRRDLPG
jgi:ABC-2 type transport system permease protein